MVKKKAPAGKLKRSNKFLIISIAILAIVGVFAFMPGSVKNRFLSSQSVNPPTTEPPATTTSTCESTDPQHPGTTECGGTDVADLLVKSTPKIMVYDSICQPRASEPYWYVGTWWGEDNVWKNRSAWYIGTNTWSAETQDSWVVDPDKEADFNKKNKEFSEAMDKLSVVCGNQVKKNMVPDKPADKDPTANWLGLCNGCPSGSSGCVNPLGEGNFEIPKNDKGNIGQPDDDFVTMEEISKDGWNTCYRAYCGGTDEKLVEVEWSCGKCRADDCSESSNKAAEEAAKAKAATEAAYQSEVNAMGANTITTSTAGPGSGSISRVQSYPSNPAVLTLVPVPQASSLFTGFTGACTGKEPCILLIGNKMSTTATFVLAPVNGECGATNNACTKGTSSDATDSSPQYLWSCLGLHGGGNTACSANKPVYTVTYNANGATSGLVPKGQRKIHGVNLTLAVNSGKLARSGYTFVGWGTVDGVSYQAGGMYSVDKPVRLNAMWKQNRLQTR